MASTSQASSYYFGGFNPGGFSMGTYVPGAYGGTPYAVPTGQASGQTSGPAQSAPQAIDTRNLGPEEMLRVGVDTPAQTMRRAPAWRTRTGITTASSSIPR